MKEYISEGRAVYEDYNHGQFSKKLAEWAIGKMRSLSSTGDKLTAIKSVDLDTFKEILKQYAVKISESSIYTAWYLYNMAIADYPKCLKTDEQRVWFVSETLNDPDGCPESVLECFTAKMCCAGVPIFWENYI